MKNLLPWIVAFLMFGVLIAMALPLPRSTSALPENEPAPLLTSVDWLSANLGDPDLVLLHVGDNAEYGVEHIPGAQFVSLQDISTPRGSFPPLELPPVPQLQQFFEKTGMSGRIFHITGILSVTYFQMLS